ncbi:MAG: hypothetical protein IJ410_00215 [Oscillospiraceae bacterium]|nr:hypothetical protein [Oscillospiraceae bacterium]
MNKFLMYMINLIYTAHNKILSLNDAYEYNFTDKELHFLVIGVIGMLMIFAIYPVFKWLAKHGHIMTITWIYVFTLVIVLTFSIEIGQKAGNNGSMEFADIVFGVVGFLAMFLVFAVIRGILHLIIKLIRKTKARKAEKQQKVNT